MPLPQFTAEEKIQLFNRLPALELSYEPKLHKKVYSSVYYIIPKGPKALIWYTYWHEENVCLLVLLNERGNYSDIRVYPAVFSDKLALGTVIYGTYFQAQQVQAHIAQHIAPKHIAPQPQPHHHFSCEKLYYYKGQPVFKKTNEERLAILIEMFEKEVQQIAYTPSSIVVGLPVMTDSYETALDLADKMPYRVYGIGGWNPPGPPMRGNTLGGVGGSAHQGDIRPPAIRSNTFGGVACSSPQRGVRPPGGSGGPAPHHIFLVKADLAADIYHLYAASAQLPNSPQTSEYYDIAMVSSYKNSVMLNGIFRRIKENANLDLLEESDSEDEFENIHLDKFVDLEKIVKMECVYLKKFQKWQPVKMVSNHLPLISLKEAQQYSLNFGKQRGLHIKIFN